MHNLIDIQAGSMLLVDKPIGWTSFDVVNKIRYALKHALQVKKIKVGHAGTLDPAATGLLIICVGKMTKQIDKYQGLQKEYEGRLVLGATTPSYDGETETDRIYPTNHLSTGLLKKSAQTFEGDIMQKPPMYSAIKKDGVRLYTLARKNLKVEIPARPVYIKKFELVDIDLPNVEFRVICSKGTYIRSLVHDYGQLVNSGAYLGALRRTAIGPYRVDDAWQIDPLISKINDMSHEHSG